jgi:hypothetical protein
MALRPLSMKKHPAKLTRQHPAKRVKAKAKRVVQKTARRAAKLTQAAAAKALADLQRGSAGLKSKAKGKAARVERAFAQATKLNRLVKRMKSAGLI